MPRFKLGHIIENNINVMNALNLAYQKNNLPIVQFFFFKNASTNAKDN